MRGFCPAPASHPPGMPDSRAWMSNQRVMADPIPFLVCLGLGLLLVWLWDRFSRR